MFRLGPLQITTVEMVLYATLLAWGWGVAAATLLDRSNLSPRRVLAVLGTDPMTRAAVSWGGVLVASAVTAPSARAAALKFALRSLSGIFVFFAVRTLARSAEVARRVLWALAAGALLSAATAVAEVLVPASDTLWSHFREGGFDTFGLRRASGVFGYPTIGAMYWEAAVPLLVVAPFLGASRRNLVERRGPRLALLSNTLLVAAILASATRSALAGAALGCVALFLLGRRSGGPLPRVAVATLGLIVVSASFALGASGPSSLLGQRLRWWRDDTWFGVHYEMRAGPAVVKADELFRVPGELRNTGTITWPRAGPHPTHLAYHWALGEPPCGSTAYTEFNGLRSELQADVPPGGALEVVGTVRAPSRGGRYSLCWDLVQENVTWFSERGNAMAEQSVDVEGGAATPPATEVSTPGTAPPAARSATTPPTRIALWRAAVLLWRAHPLLGIGPDNFRRLYPSVLPRSPTGQPYTDTRIHANSLYFETLADLGLAGILALASIAHALARDLRKHWAAGRLAGLAFGVAAGTFFVHGALDYFLEFTPLYGLFWLLLALTSTSGPEAPGSSELRHSPP